MNEWRVGLREGWAAYLREFIRAYRASRDAGRLPTSFAQPASANQITFLPMLSLSESQARFNSESARAYRRALETEADGLAESDSTSAAGASREQCRALTLLALKACGALAEHLYYARRDAADPCTLLCRDEREGCDCHGWQRRYTGVFFAAIPGGEDGAHDWANQVTSDALTARVFRDILAVAHTPSFRYEDLEPMLKRRIRQTLHDLRSYCDPAGAHLYENLCAAMVASAQAGEIVVLARQSQESEAVEVHPSSGSDRHFDLDGRPVNPWNLWEIVKQPPGEADLMTRGQILARSRSSPQWLRYGILCGLAGPDQPKPEPHANNRLEALHEVLQALEDRATFGVLHSTLLADVGPEAAAVWSWAREVASSVDGRSPRALGQTARWRVREVAQAILEDPNFFPVGGREHDRSGTPRSLDEALDQEGARTRAASERLEAFGSECAKEAKSATTRMDDAALLFQMIDWTLKRATIRRTLEELATSPERPETRLAAGLGVLLRGGEPSWGKVRNLVLRLGVGEEVLCELLTSLREGTPSASGLN